MKVTINNIIIPIERDQDKGIRQELAKKGMDISNILNIDYLKRSIDSRKKSQIKFLYNLELSLKNEVDLTLNKYKNFSRSKELLIKPRKSKELKGQIGIVGAGPAGLFAALRLCEYGYQPIIFERGKKVEERDKSIDEFYSFDNLDINSNIQFGEGGAGTYSDGKLNTRVKSEYISYVFKNLVELGAQEKIMWDYKPHIGTDILKVVTKNLRNKIISMGGTFYFDTLVDNVIIKNNKIVGVEINKVKKSLNTDNKKREKIELEHLLLGVGHSARDTYRMLERNGVFMENKPFAMGVRIEHPREIIDKIQYGKFRENPNLEAATYSMTYNNKSENRGVFSFCMCPGGVIVNAASELNTSLVNGMSYSKRDGKFSNSAIAVGIKANEFGEELFSGMKYQEKLERSAYGAIKNYGGVAQRALDFMNGKKSASLPESSYPMRITSLKLDKFLPNVIEKNMKLAFKQWQKIPDFITNDVLLIGPETRTSAPIKITRNELGESINVRGLYPIGEGAGYAGGITSAAIDGVKIVDNIFAKII